MCRNIKPSIVLDKVKGKAKSVAIGDDTERMRDKLRGKEKILVVNFVLSSLLRVHLCTHQNQKGSYSFIEQDWELPSTTF